MSRGFMLLVLVILGLWLMLVATIAHCGERLESYTVQTHDRVAAGMVRTAITIDTMIWLVPHWTDSAIILDTVKHKKVKK